MLEEGGAKGARPKIHSTEGSVELGKKFSLPPILKSTNILKYY